MPSFKRETLLPASADEAFAWHARPGAFERLCPPWQRIEVLERQGGVADGGRLAFRLYQGPLPIRWVAEHRDVVPGRRFRDVQVEGPFAAWSHTHGFTPRDDGCLLSDEIDYQLPAGPLGQLVGGGRVRRDLERLFAFRHRTTAEDLALHARYRDRPRLAVAVSGASGLIGSALAAFLETGGHRVLRLVRREPAGDGEARWDPARGVADPERLEGLDAVVHLAGENIAGGRWTPQRKERLVTSRVDATRRLTAALAGLERPPKAFVCASAVGFYGDRGDEPLAEDAAAGRGFLAELTERWEEAAAGAARGRVVTLRFGVVLSPRGGALAKMLPAFKAGGGGPLGSGRQLLSWIALDDAVGAIHHALMTEDLSGPVNVTAPEPVPQGRFAAVLGRVLRRPAFLPVPAPTLRLLFGEMADETLLASTRALPAKLMESGYGFRQGDLADALAHMLGRKAPESVAAV